jgi:hypothetical protein
MQSIYRTRAFYYFRYKVTPAAFKNCRYPTDVFPTGIPWTTSTIYGLEAKALIDSGCAIMEHAPYAINNQTRVKPMNVLVVDRPHDILSIRQLILSLPLNLDLRTVNLDDYPEYFI